MRCLLILISLVFGVICYAQKPSLYLGDNFNEISKAEYEKKEKDYHLLLSYETDSLNVFVKTKRETFGRLSDTQLANVYTSLETTTQQEIIKEGILVIQYYPGKDKCNSSGSTSFVKNKYKSNNRKILKKDNHQPFFIYKNDKGLEPYKKVVKWHQDYNQTIEKLFFPLHYNCSSFVIIKSNGAFFSYKGEYSNNQLFTALESDEFLNK